MAPYFDPCAAYLSAQSGKKSEVPTRPGKKSEMPDLAADPEDPFADPEDPFADPVDPSTDPGNPIADPSRRLDCIEQVFRIKLITWSFEGLDFEYHDIDFVSFDVDTSKGPKGLQCSEKLRPSPIIVPDGKSYMCPLCEEPGSSKLVQGLRKRKIEIQREKEAKEKAIFQETAQTGKSFVNGLKFRFNRRRG